LNTDSSRKICVITAAILTATASANAVYYEVVILHPVGLEQSYAFGASGGQQVGYGSAGTIGNHALLWEGAAESVVDLRRQWIRVFVCFRGFGRTQVGYGWSSASVQHALLWLGTAESVIDLHSFLPAGYSSSQTHYIDSMGNIVGYAKTNTGDAHAVSWQIPEPTTAALLALGSLVMLRRGRA